MSGDLKESQPGSLDGPGVSGTVRVKRVRPVNGVSSSLKAAPSTIVSPVAWEQAKGSSSHAGTSTYWPLRRPGAQGASDALSETFGRSLTAAVPK